MEACLEKSSRISFWRQKLRYTFSMLDVYKKGVSLPVSAFQQCLWIYQIVLFWNFQPNASVLRRCKLWMLLTWGILSTCRVVSNAVWMVWDTHTQSLIPSFPPSLLSPSGLPRLLTPLGFLGEGNLVPYMIISIMTLSKALLTIAISQ